MYLINYQVLPVHLVGTVTEERTAQQDVLVPRVDLALWDRQAPWDRQDHPGHLSHECVSTLFRSKHKIFPVIPAADPGIPRGGPQPQRGN